MIYLYLWLHYAGQRIRFFIHLAFFSCYTEQLHRLWQRITQSLLQHNFKEAGNGNQICTEQYKPQADRKHNRPLSTAKHPEGKKIAKTFNIWLILNWKGTCLKLQHSPRWLSNIPDTSPKQRKNHLTWSWTVVPLLIQDSHFLFYWKQHWKVHPSALKLYIEVDNTLVKIPKNINLTDALKTYGRNASGKSSWEINY